jgi:hypothetical protein
MRQAARSMRWWLPLAVAWGSLIAVGFVDPLLAWLLCFLSFGLLIEVFTAWFERCGATGGLPDHRQ